MIPAHQTQTETSPFHDGERLIQDRLGEQEIQRWARGAIRDFMPDQHRTFFEEQPFLIVSARDDKGRPWATVIEGKHGFVQSPDPVSLHIAASPVRGDALEGAFQSGSDIGLIGIELATRRRNRVNGKVIGKGEGGIRFEVGQSFGNCPQYIRARDYWWSPDEPAVVAKRVAELTASQRDWIRAADTFFIATGYQGEGDNPAFGMDVSHRGGERGFVEIIDAQTLRFPDYAGNRFYNTLGNILLDARAGFLFLDFQTGSLLQITGKATIDFDSEEVGHFPGARQLVSLQIEEIVELTSALRLRWQHDAEAARTLRLVEKSNESDDVTSFLFEARDSGQLAPFHAGQHLPLELKIPGVEGKVQRSYSLSGSPSDTRYRISVKREREGLVSRFLHDRLEVGAILESRKPAGEFVVSTGELPVVLVSAGIGVTPVLSMLHERAETGGTRPVHFIHGARDGAHHPFRDEVARLVSGMTNAQSQTFYSRPRQEDIQGRDYDGKGRISADLILDQVAGVDAEFLLCGPAGFVAELITALQASGVSEQNIQFETF